MASATIKTIGGRSFSFAKLAAVDGIKLQLAVAKLVGSELAAIAMLVEQKTTQARLFQEIGSMLENVASKASESEVISLMTLVFKKATCEGKPINDLDLTFGEDTMTLWQAFIEALKVNLSDFLAVVPSGGSQPDQEKHQT